MKGLVLVAVMVLAIVTSGENSTEDRILDKARALLSPTQHKELDNLLNTFHNLRTRANAMCTTELSSNPRYIESKGGNKPRWPYRHIVLFLEGCEATKIFIEKSAGELPMISEEVRKTLHMNEIMEVIKKAHEIGKGDYIQIGKYMSLRYNEFYIFEELLYVTMRRKKKPVV